MIPVTPPILSPSVVIRSATFGKAEDSDFMPGIFCVLRASPNLSILCPVGDSKFLCACLRLPDSNAPNLPSLRDFCALTSMPLTFILPVKKPNSDSYFS